MIVCVCVNAFLSLRTASPFESNDALPKKKEKQLVFFFILQFVKRRERDKFVSLMMMERIVGLVLIYLNMCGNSNVSVVFDHRLSFAWQHSSKLLIFKEENVI